MKTCLVVDDSSVTRKVARRILEGFEFQIVEAEDGEQALDVCRAQMPDAVRSTGTCQRWTATSSCACCAGCRTATGPRWCFAPPRLAILWAIPGYNPRTPIVSPTASHADVFERAGPETALRSHLPGLPGHSSADAGLTEGSKRGKAPAGAFVGATATGSSF